MINKNILNSNHYRSLVQSLQMVRNRFIFFVLFLVYLFLSILGTTDKMLYMNTPIKMPLLNLDLPLIAFYIVMPIFILSLQFNLLFVLNRYKEKLLKISRKYNKDIQSLPFGLYEGAIFYNGFFIWILKSILVFLLLILPIFVLFSFWFRFADYQDLTATTCHFIFILLSISISVYYKNIVNSKVSNFISVALLVLVLPIIIFYQFFIFMPFSKKNVNSDELKAAYENYNKEYLGIHLLPTLIVKSQILRPIDKDIMGLIKDLDTDKSKALLLYSTPHIVENRKFRYANFSNSVMVKTHFKNVNLQRANFSMTNMEESNFEDSNLNKIFMEYSNLKNTAFINVNADEGWFVSANLNGVFMNSSSFQSADFASCTLLDSNLDSVNFINAYFMGADLAFSNLRGLNFTYAHLNFTTFIGASMSNISMVSAHIENTSFHACTMMNIDWRSVYSGHETHAFMESYKYDSNITGIANYPLADKDIAVIISKIENVVDKEKLKYCKMTLKSNIGKTPISNIEHNPWAIFGKLLQGEVNNIVEHTTNKTARKSMSRILGRVK